MNESIFQLLTDDHVRLDRLLREVAARLPVPGSEAYADFRRGLHRHISVEEEYILPAILRLARRESQVVQRLRLDHRALRALVALPPAEGIVRLIGHNLLVHHAGEEQEGGLYWQAVRAMGTTAEEVLARLRAPFTDGDPPWSPAPEALREAKEAVRLAGYVFPLSS